jgi:Inner membrane component of T3SS, cytoplasmic domain
MDTAKFCGNCGTPFPRSPVPSSSLVNCPQGHIYSAVYEHCPYCPLPETVGADSQPVVSQADFATKVEATDASETLADTASLKAGSADKANGRTAPYEAGNERKEYESLQTSIGDSSAETSIGEPSIEPTVLTPSDITRVEPPVKRTREPEPRSTPVAPAPRSDSGIPPPPPPAPSPIREPQLADNADRRTVLMQAGAGDVDPKSKGKIVGWLISYSKNRDGVDFRLRTGHNRVGAHPACDIVVDDDTVSGSHAVIVYRDGHCLIKDDLSRNGTFVNGVEITEARTLQNYDQIRVGNTTLIFVAAESGQ